MAIHTLWGTTGNGQNGPGSSTIFAAGGVVVATSFKITQAGQVLLGYGWGIADAGQPQTAGQVFCAWQEISAVAGTLVPGTTKTAGPLALGWNYLFLTPPVALTAGVTYRVQTASSNGTATATDGYWGV